MARYISYIRKYDESTGEYENKISREPMEVGSDRQEVFRATLARIRKHPEAYGVVEAWAPGDKNKIYEPLIDVEECEDLTEFRFTEGTEGMQ